MWSKKNKIMLAPRLRWGVGKDTNRINYLNWVSGIFLAIAITLVVRAGWMVIYPSSTPAESAPQVLGEVDSQQPLFTEYKVKGGDTLFTIAQAHQVDWTMLATLNGLKAPFTLQVNQTLKIPKQ